MCLSTILVLKAEELDISSLHMQWPFIDYYLVITVFVVFCVPKTQNVISMFKTCKNYFRNLIVCWKVLSRLLLWWQSKRNDAECDMDKGIQMLRRTSAFHRERTLSRGILDTITFLLYLGNRIIAGTYIRWNSSKGVHNFCWSPLLLIQALEHHEKCVCYKMQELGKY